MRILGRLKISHRLNALSALGLLAMLTIGAVAYTQVDTISANKEVSATTTAVVGGLNEIDVAHSDIQVAEREAMLGDLHDATIALDEVVKKTDPIWARLDNLSMPDDQRAQLDKAHTTFSGYLEETRQMLPSFVNTSDVPAALAKERKRAETTDVVIEGTIDAFKQAAGVARESTTAAIHNVKTIVLITAVLALIVLIAASVLISRSIVGPLKALTQTLQRVAHRDLTARADTSRRDEIGTMSSALNEALDSVQGTISDLGQTAQTLALAADELTAISARVGENAERASTTISVVAGSANEVSGDVNTMSAATEEMTSSIGEIAQNAANAANVASQAVTSAEQTTEAVEKLDVASTEIGEIIKTITSIAEQTNLLALNATIEAARAGDAGKGFAVVASEVKDLAQETARATEDITNKIASIQQTTHDAAGAIGQISGVVNQIRDMQATIAAAVEEQSATTAEISRSVSGVANGSQAIAENINDVASAAASAAEGASSTRESASHLSNVASEVRRLVDQFSY